MDLSCQPELLHQLQPQAEEAAGGFPSRRGIPGGRGQPGKEIADKAAL